MNTAYQHSIRVQSLAEVGLKLYCLPHDIKIVTARTKPEHLVPFETTGALHWVPYFCSLDHLHCKRPEIFVFTLNKYWLVDKLNHV